MGAHAIDPAQCSINVSKVKVEVKLVKAIVGVQWRHLERTESEQAAAAAVVTSDQPAYPTSNKQKKDWSTIDKECDDELKKEKGEGEDALNKLFREIYGKADE